ncbi:Wzz/FepE/Etk N-terminal domain-containing protein [Limosilactobacillus coleohominis]|uniref:Wzz/FepE/Etk N-terminal domain-containing protein n=1 Tax=Limosilactobacillus coleohominis TaxID=181675 RepID=UPI0019583318|nr:Wzz/FepE/Etk N-terminal domain-containing protein [Limosilactobacillus coleohominis]MBM6954601.1 chain-length determining protein [Limosilactobacillus coleohominis]
MKQYTPANLVKTFWKSIICIFILAIIGGGCMGIVAKHKQSTTYTSTQSVLISHNIEQDINNSNPQDSLTIADMNMMKTYAQIAESPNLITTAHKQLPSKIKKQYSINSMMDAINTKTRDQSLVLTISAKSSDKQSSMEMSNAVVNTLQKDLSKYQPGAGEVHVLAKKSMHNVTSETTPHLKKYVAVGVALGGMIGIIISFVEITLKDLMNRSRNN